MPTKIAIAFCCLTSAAFGSVVSIREEGINSQVTGLTGMGVPIGQTEGGRPGKRVYDFPENSADNTTPTEVYSMFGGIALPNSEITVHATLVAGVMIGTDASEECNYCEGVAPAAQLHAMAGDVDTETEAVLALNRLVTNPINVRAINMSFGVELAPFIEHPDGNSLSSQYVDWAARRYNRLFVISWLNSGDDPDGHKPQDSYNGITAAASMAGPESVVVYRKYSEFNAPPGSTTAWGERAPIDILAPGHQLRILGHTGVEIESGSSYAAAHTTGAVALLHQYAVQQFGLGTNSQRHEVMKAVVLNSADKIADVHGSDRTILSSTGEPYPDSNGPFQPLHREMGVGHLNVERAVAQMEAGEQNPGIVPLTGWDYQTIGTSGDSNEYIFNQSAGGYLVATLVWDRIVNHTGGNTYHEGDAFENHPYTDTINNLNLYLVTADAGTWDVANSIWPSASQDDNLEHIWFNVPAGEYKLVVHHETEGGPGSSQNYGLAWWFDNAEDSSADFNGDGSIDAADYIVWRKQDGTPAGYNLWRSQFGQAGIGMTSSVPEPSSLLLAAMILGWFWRNKCR